MEVSDPMKDVRDLHFIVIGSYVADCIANTASIPMWDDNIIADSVRLTPGGKGLNQAIALARLGARVSAVGVIAEDPAGLTILNTLQVHGIDTSLMRHDQKSGTAICICFVGDSGQTAFLWRIPESMAITTEDIRKASAQLKSADGVLMTLEMPLASATEALTILHESKAQVALQPFPVPEGTHSLPFKAVDIVVPNLAEARTFIQELGRMPSNDVETLPRQIHKETGIPHVMVTCGENGSLQFLNGKLDRFPAHHADKVIDTTGASDAFTAHLVASIAVGLPADVAVNNASVAAAFAIQRPGGYDSMPWMPLGGKPQHA
ncbi:PfkB family carbohydrate kinase [Nocardia sp. NPDC059228]|uniref:PfkB family carbohydrate kinase n=1 Tax=Nocardia sp. NPDC059228 TaxID=3346777 RepID=UPI0036BE410F